MKPDILDTIMAQKRAVYNIKIQRGDHYNLLFFILLVNFAEDLRVIPGRLERPTNRTGICHSIH